MADTVLRAKARKPGARGSFKGMFRTSGRGRASATFPAKATAPSSRSPSMRASKSFVPASFSEGTGVPEAIMLTAASIPTTRGNRCVPPAPGRSPSFTSGSAIWAPGEATR